MARMPDGWVVTVEAEGMEVRIHDSRELIMCKHCWKRGRDNCPMRFYWDNHSADDDCFCRMGERREAEPWYDDYVDN